MARLLLVRGSVPEVKEWLGVADVMTRDVYAVAPETSIDTAARLFAARHISGAPVVTGAGRPVGVVTLVDLVDPDRQHSEREGYPLFYRLHDGQTMELGEEVEVGAGQVADVMSPFVLSIKSSASIVAAAQLMLSETVHRLLILEGNKLVGIVTSTDLLRGFVRAMR